MVTRCGLAQLNPNLRICSEPGKLLGLILLFPIGEVMSFLMTNALAQSAATTPVSPQGGGLSQILILLGFVVIFYLLLWRPQAKRAKEHRQLMANLVLGDEVTTTGGIVGKVTRLEGDLISLKVAENVEIHLQKAAVSSVLPKGTIKS